MGGYKIVLVPFVRAVRKDEHGKKASRTWTSSVVQKDGKPWNSDWAIQEAKNWLAAAPVIAVDLPVEAAVQQSPDSSNPPDSPADGVLVAEGNNDSPVERAADDEGPIGVWEPFAKSRRE